MASIIVLALSISGVVQAADIGTYNYTKSPNLNSTAISQFNSTANTSSCYKFDSIIYESPFNLTSLHPEYTLTLAISEHATPNAPDSSTTESLIFLTPPAESGVGVGNDSLLSQWNSCAVIFKQVTPVATKRGESEDGSCFPTLGKACIDALHAQVSDNTDDEVSCQYLVSSIPAVCADAIRGDQGELVPFTLNPTFNSTSPIPLLLTTSEQHDAANKSYYDEASHRIWPVLLYQRALSGTPESQQGSSITQMKCLRDVKAVRSGSGTETDSPTSTPKATDKPGAGVSMGAPTGVWSFVAANIVLGLFMVI